MEVHLRTGRNFWQRLVHGIAYAFGKKSRYVAWDEFVLVPDQLLQIKIKQILNHNGKERFN
jgi:hypothetical protein